MNSYTTTRFVRPFSDIFSVYVDTFVCVCAGTIQEKIVANLQSFVIIRVRMTLRNEHGAHVFHTLPDERGGSKCFPHSFFFFWNALS